MEHLTRLIDEAIAEKNYGSLVKIFSSSSEESWQTVGQGEKRSLAAHLIQASLAAPGFLPTALGPAEDVFLTALSHLPATVENASDNELRERLFAYKTSSDDPDYVGAARILSGMRMTDDHSSVYYVPAAKKTDIYVKIAECFLAEDEIAEADAAVNKAGSVVSQIPSAGDHKALLLRYKSTYARVLDFNRKFLSAAQRYHELSSEDFRDLIDEDDLMQMLGRAATCAILAPVSPQRQRVLGHIYRDARLERLTSMTEYATHPAILRKMYRRQVLKPTELTQFEESLADHQKAIMGDGLTIMERGVVEHNMMAVGELYRSIYMSELANLLGVSPAKAEKIASTMIMDGTLHGSIDQVEGLLELEPKESAEETWDRSITAFCVELNAVTDAVKTSMVQ